MHAKLPSIAAYLPAKQSVQTEALAAEYLPATQLMHTEEPAVGCDLPASQFVHTEAPVAEYWPAAQRLQAALPDTAL